MVKRIGRRFVSLLLTFVTVLTMLPAMTLPALAATSGTLNLTDTSIGLSFTGDAEVKWSADDTTITGSATSTAGSCGNSTAYESTLTITNKGTTTARLSFGYAIEQNSGTIQVDGTKVSASGAFTKELAPNETATVYIKSGSTAAATKITMTNVKLEASATATVTFQPAKNGSYTVNGEAITTEAHTYTQSSLIAYKVVATPNEGFQFLGWYDDTNKIYLRGSASSSIYVSSGNSEVTAIFRAKGTTFQEGTSDLKWDDLNDAIISTRNNGSEYIKQLKSYTISGEYTIPSGVTLLIPFDDAGTLYRETPEATKSDTKAKPFRTLTMASGSSITLESGAAISVGGQYYAASGGSKGKMVGPYGYIKMESGSAITVKNGANLYAWGFISGSGSVTVASGGSVYEWYQIMDFRGGSASSNMGNKVFPFNQYAVQNIEVPMTLYAGASEMACSAIDAAGGIKLSSIPFIGTESKGLFRLTSGSLTKAYDGSTDRMIYTIDGVAELSNLSLKLSFVSIDSKKYVLPLTNNMTIDLNSGSKLTLNQTAALLPGVEVSIARDAELVVPEGQSMYIYGKAEWGNYCGHGDGSTFIPVVYAPGKIHNRTDENLVDVKVDVNGKLTAIGGIYTTESGANICSSEGTGKYLQQGAPGNETTTYQYDGGTTKHDIPITAAQLKNADGVNPSYTPTAGSKAGDTFIYCKCPGCGNGTWVKDFAAIIYSDGTQTNCSTLQEAVKQFPQNSSGSTYIKILHSTTENITASKNLYLDLNGRTVTGDISVTSGYKLYGMDSSAKTDYTTAPTGKIVGTVTGYAPTYQTPGDTYDCYVAIPGTEADNETANLSFHRFNISVSGYRFELKAPECALFFIGKFQGDDAAKNHLTKLGFTLTDIDKTEKKYGCTITGKTIPLMPTGGGTSTSEVVQDAEGAYFFEAYLMRSFNKNDTAAYQTKISATAQASFDNGGKQQSDPRNLSFEDAWTNPGELDPAQKDILDKFLKALNIPNP